MEGEWGGGKGSLCKFEKETKLCGEQKNLPKCVEMRGRLSLEDKEIIFDARFTSANGVIIL